MRLGAVALDAVAHAFGLALLVSTLACAPADTDGVADAGVDAGPRIEPVFPADLSGYTEMRDCRSSHEHELNFIRVLVDDAALPVYRDFTGTYPPGATLVKLEYRDEGCTDLIGYTAMRRTEPGALPAGGDWRWQQLDKQRRVVEDGAPVSCVDCHAYHCAPPNGYYLTCAEEL